MKHWLLLNLVLALLCFTVPDRSGMAAPQSAPPGQSPALSPGEPLMLSRALALVLGNNPEMRVSGLEARAAAARVLQAGLRPNPEFSALGESFLAMGGDGLFRYTESTFQLSQRLELGGKRGARVRSREKEVMVAEERSELRKADLIAETSLAFADVLAGQERLANRRELSKLAQQVFSTVVERVAAGKVSPVEQTRATVALSSAQLEEDKQTRELVAAKDRLAALWGGVHSDFGRAEAPFEIPAGRPEPAQSCVDNAPELKVAAASIDLHRSILESEQAARKPDLTLSGGFKRLNLENVQAWVAGASIPLPLFDRRQGSIAEARIGIEKSMFEKKAVEWALRSSLAQARHRHEVALLEATTLARTAIPAARDALSATEEGYRFGKFDFMNVLDAQRSYAELQRQHIEAVAAGLRAAIEIDRLAPCGTARPVLAAAETKEESHEK